ncbi:MAG: hypothetical protein LUG13_00090 [Oscillospiraceae bacterium]|nr:hypothetical protein [Oscillospiraceae bacterium]
MLNEMKYAVRIHLNQRVIALGATVVLNLIFAICGKTGAAGTAGMITGVTLCSLALCGLIIVNIIADVASIRSLFTAPAGYLYTLTPQPRWKVLLGRVLVILIWDLVTLLIAAFGVAIQAAIFAGGMIQAQFFYPDLTSSLWSAAIFVLYYALVLLSVFFAAAVAKGLLFRIPGRGFLGFLVFCAVLYVHSVLNLLLSPFAHMSHYGAFFSISITPGANAGMIAFLILMAIELVALFCATTYLMERKVNL